MRRVTGTGSHAFFIFEFNTNNHSVRRIYGNPLNIKLGNNIGVYPNTSCHAEQSEASRAGTLQETLRDPSYRQDDNIAVFSMPWVNSYIIALNYQRMLHCFYTRKGIMRLLKSYFIPEEV